jgi:hypothetical protein
MASVVLTCRQQLEPHGRKSVRALMARGGQPAEALATIAAGNKLIWEPWEWQLLLAALDACDMRVDDWLLVH